MTPWDYNQNLVIWGHPSSCRPLSKPHPSWAACLSQPLGSLVSSLRLRTWPVPAPVPRRLGCSLLGTRPHLFAVGGKRQVVPRSGLATWCCRAGCGCSIFLGRHWVVAATPRHCPLILVCPAWRGCMKPHIRGSGGVITPSHGWWKLHPHTVLCVKPHERLRRCHHSEPHARPWVSFPGNEMRLGFSLISSPHSVDL